MFTSVASLPTISQKNRIKLKSISNQSTVGRQRIDPLRRITKGFLSKVTTHIVRNSWRALKAISKAILFHKVVEALGGSLTDPKKIKAQERGILKREAVNTENSGAV